MTWLDIARRRSVVTRALRVACVVCPILIAINHGDAIVRGDVSSRRLIQMLLTFFVPYGVSTFSSVGAIREGRKTRVGSGAGAAEGRELESGEIEQAHPRV